MSPALSIITPTFNRVSFLPECLRSLVSQRFHDWEWIIVDDGSTDGTTAVVADMRARESRIRYVRQNNRGPSAARNRGIDLAQGAWLTFLDSDDLFLPGAFSVYSSLIQAADLDREVGIVAGTVIEAKTQPVTDSQNCSAEGFQLSDMFYRVLGFSTTGPHVLLLNSCVRRSIIDEYSLRFDSTLRTAEDRELLICMTARSHVLHVETPVAWYRRGDWSSDEASLVGDDKLRAHQLIYGRLLEYPSVRIARLSRAEHRDRVIAGRLAYLRMLDAVQQTRKGEFREAAHTLRSVAEMCSDTDVLAALLVRFRYLSGIQGRATARLDLASVLESLVNQP